MGRQLQAAAPAAGRRALERGGLWAARPGKARILPLAGGPSPWGPWSAVTTAAPKARRGLLQRGHPAAQPLPTVQLHG